MDADVETYFVRFIDGPLDGTRPVRADRIPFPPPEVDEYPDFGGKYVRDSYSILPERFSPNVARGAQYHWEKAE